VLVLQEPVLFRFQQVNVTREVVYPQIKKTLKIKLQTKDLKHK